MTAATSYHLVPHPAAPEVPTLDLDQQRVVDHPGGPLLVLAGPGTGLDHHLGTGGLDRGALLGCRPPLAHRSSSSSSLTGSTGARSRRQIGAKSQTAGQMP